MLSGVCGYTKNGCIGLTNTLLLIAPLKAKWGLYLFYFFQDTKKLRPCSCSIKYSKKKNHWNLNKKDMKQTDSFMASFWDVLCGLVKCNSEQWIYIPHIIKKCIFNEKFRNSFCSYWIYLGVCNHCFAYNATTVGVHYIALLRLHRNTLHAQRFKELSVVHAFISIYF